VTLPHPILSFWIASLDLNTGVRHTPWGAIVADPRYPRVYEANHASVLHLVPELTLEDIRADLLPALEESRATHEHIEIMDADDHSPAVRDLLSSPGEHDPDVVMIFEGEDPPARPRSSSKIRGEIRVEEVVEPDDSFWKLYRLAPNEYGQPLPDEVLDQMLARVQEVFLPWERFFIAMVEDSIAGMASVLRLVGVAYIDNVVTLPQFRRRGVATALVNRVVAASLEAGASAAFLLAEENGAPQYLYERLGFRVRRRCYGFTRPLRGAASPG
jgi:GNAT superfamily N-acetyltransferase